MAAKRFLSRRVVVVLCCGAGLALVLAWVLLRPAASGTPPISHFEHTAVVPTLDTPLPDGESAVWCASFQLAWNRLKDDVTHGPVQLRGAEAVAERLNRAQVSEADLRPDDYFAAAGTGADGIRETVQGEMSRRFPDAAPSAPQLPPAALSAYAFVSASAPWRFEFHDNPEALPFIDASGRRTPVRSFGILKSDEFQDTAGKFFRGQVALLWESEGKGRTRDEYAVDLCRHSAPYQVVLARVSRKATLAETLDDLRLKMQQDPPAKDRLDEEDTLLVPTMHWRIEHHFKELEGTDKVLLNGPVPGLYLASAVQAVQFRLDRRGAEVASGVYLAYANGGPRRLHFDRPFLLYMKMRDAKQPVLVMWVESAELMQRF